MTSPLLMYMMCANFLWSVQSTSLRQIYVLHNAGHGPTWSNRYPHVGGINICFEKLHLCLTDVTHAKREGEYLLNSVHTLVDKTNVRTASCNESKVSYDSFSDTDVAALILEALMSSIGRTFGCPSAFRPGTHQSGKHETNSCQ